MDKSQLRTGDVILVHHPFQWKRGLSYVNWLIQGITSSYWDHVEIVRLDVSVNEPILVSSVYNIGVREISCRSFNELHPQCIVSVVRPSHIFSVSRVYELSNDMKGRVKYDLKGSLIDQLWYKLTGKYIGPKGGPRSIKKMYCSEFVAKCLNLPFWYKACPRDIDLKLDGEVLYVGPFTDLLYVD